MKVTLNKFKNKPACAITAALSVLISSTAYSAERVKHVIDIPEDVKTTSGKTAPQPYRPVADVTPELAQIVVYYPEGSVPATIYVDRELQSVLLPGQFTVLCAAPARVESGSTITLLIRGNKILCNSSMPRVRKPILFRLIRYVRKYGGPGRAF